MWEPMSVVQCPKCGRALHYNEQGRFWFCLDCDSHLSPKQNNTVMHMQILCMLWFVTGLVGGALPFLLLCRGK